VGEGRQTIWLHPAVLLRFTYSGSRTPQVNPAWVHALDLAANTSSGLQCVPEPDVRECRFPPKMAEDAGIPR